jgi:anti-anti-sigma factor
MSISSRTPEGEPCRCPLCGAENDVEPSSPPGDAPCPQCGHLIWFSAEHGGGELNLKYQGPHFTPEMARGLENLVMDQRDRDLVIDLENVPYLSSGALAVLINIGKVIRQANLKVRRVHPDLREVFRITRLDRHIGVE